VAVTYTDGRGSDEGPIVSESVGPIVNINDEATGVPKIIGRPIEGQILIANTNAINDDDGTGVFTYQWMRSGSPILGATEGVYKLDENDTSYRISVNVSYVDARGVLEGPISSLSVGPVSEDLSEQATEELIDVPATAAALPFEAATVEGLTEGLDSVGDDVARNETFQTTPSAQLPASKTVGIVSDKEGGEALVQPIVVENPVEKALADEIEVILHQRWALKADGSNEQPISFIDTSDDVVSLVDLFNTENDLAYASRTLAENLDSRRENLDQQASNAFQVNSTVTTVTSSAALAYIISLARGGLLLSSVMATLPAWRSIDPLPVLQDLDNRDNADDESLESMVDSSENETDEGPNREAEQLSSDG